MRERKSGDTGVGEREREIERDRKRDWGSREIER